MTMLGSRRKNVRCLDCGYLCYVEVRPPPYRPHWPIVGLLEETYHEVSPDRRTSAWRPRDTRCYRGVTDLGSEIGHVTDEQLGHRYRQVITKERECKYFFLYTPGLSPREHVERQESRERARTDRLWNLGAIIIGTLLGALLTLFVLWISNLWG